MSATSENPLDQVPKKFIDPLFPKDKSEGSRVNGKEWKISKDAFRLKSSGVRKLNKWNKREQQKLENEQYKARIDELKKEKEDEKNEKIERMKKRKEAKEEKERYEKLAAKMHMKKVDRLRKKEKRNKLLKER